MLLPPFTKKRVVIDLHKLIWLSAFCVAAVNAHAAEDSPVFTLGKIQVQAVAQTLDADSIDVGQSAEQGASNVGEVIAEVPGVIVQVGGRRAETRANIRGFDSRQVMLFLDGIPIHVPYDGNIDLSRFQLADLTQVEVTKGLGSLLEGPNALGGAINLVTRKPTKPLEGTLDVALEGGDKGLFKHSQNVQVGAILNQHFYLQAGISAFDADNFPLSSDYQPQVNNGTVYQPEGERLRSGSQNLSANLKLGYTPNSTDEYSLSFYRTEGSKESSPYAGTADMVRYWDWPQWDKQSLYYVGYTQFGSGEQAAYLKSRLFYDQFDNALNSYDDETYATVTKGYAFRSQYNDQSIGGSLEGGLPLANHLLKAALFGKQDEHKERDNDKDNADLDNRWKTFQAQTYALALEDQIQLSETSRLTFGYRYDHYEFTKTDDGDSDTDPKGAQHKDNWQAKLHHQIGAHELLAGLSLKSRFPGMKDQVSYRLGQAIPNLDLQAEQALHYEVGMAGTIANTRYQANLFYADIRDAIETVEVADTNDVCDGETCDQNQNVGSATSKGFELQTRTALTDSLDLSLSYSYLLRDLADPSIVATYSPKNTLNLKLNWYPNSTWHFGLDGHYQSQSETRFDGTRPTDGFSLWNLRAHYQINKAWKSNLVLKNVFDQNYEIAEGDPMPGRTLYANLQYRF
ncbi:TonB-dependent receptor [Thiosulfatimonas sediminis]|uniref:TonB-dependent receptor n=1 Tax=Thiosulfatimonas sediminis TaxID=2675054 RepID=A0A6F8PTZ7_9GAMM|nr:TonB-dependent receptor [Thiosulfatimonas sediminis]BBP45595.1 TonB-dependent receptor [Thiosulfatimonas sediminis]